MAAAALSALWRGAGAAVLASLPRYPTRAGSKSGLGQVLGQEACGKGKAPSFAVPVTPHLPVALFSPGGGAARAQTCGYRVWERSRTKGRVRTPGWKEPSPGAGSQGG